MIQLLILELKRSWVEPVWVLVLHLLAILGLYQVAIDIKLVWMLAGLIFLNLVFAGATLLQLGPPRLKTIIISGDELTLVDGRRNRTGKLINARVCGDFFTLLEFSAIEDASQPGWRALIRSRRTILILPVMVGRRAHCRLRRYLRFSAWRREGDGQPLI